MSKQQFRNGKKVINFRGPELYNSWRIILMFRWNTSLKENSFPTAETITIPCLPSISAAALSLTNGVECDEIEFIKLPASFLGEYLKDDKLIAINVSGESMDLLIPEGSTIVVQKIERDDLIDGDIVVYYFDNEYAVRQYRRL